MKKIKNVALSGGTHGNEFIGAYLIKKWKQNPELIQRPSFFTLPLLSNPKAHREVRRYIDRDLNRSFIKKELNNPDLPAYEADRAKTLNQILGPKGDPKFDFILDLHSTTANMGQSIILADHDPFNLQLAAHLKSIRSAVNVYRWVEPDRETSFLNSIAPFGFAIEVGPIPQGLLLAELFVQTEQLVYDTLDFLEQYNQGKTSPSKPLTVYQHQKTIDYPRNEHGEMGAMIHPERQGTDYQKLSKGDPLFVGFDGKTIPYAEEKDVWPVFINAAAYYEKGIAMCFTEKTQENPQS